jgi:uncharacterized membrane protein (DUF4010 family)
MVSSTAVANTFARRARDEKPGPALSDALATGILLAWSVMAVRVLVLVAVTSSSLLRTLLAPMIAMGLTALAGAGFFWWRSAEQQKKEEKGTPTHMVPLRNPFSLTEAVRFGVLFAVILFAVRIVRDHLPPGWIYAVAAVAGLPGVDAITLSMSSFVRNGGSEVIATRSIMVGSIANIILQFGIILWYATRDLKVRIAAATTAVAVVGIVVSVLAR